MQTSGLLFGGPRTISGMTWIRKLWRALHLIAQIARFELFQAISDLELGS